MLRLSAALAMTALVVVAIPNAHALDNCTTIPSVPKQIECLQNNIKTLEGTVTKLQAQVKRIKAGRGQLEPEGNADIDVGFRPSSVTVFGTAREVQFDPSNSRGNIIRITGTKGTQFIFVAQE